MNVVISLSQDAAAAALRVALLGNPNCGKTALFNLLTGSRQKVANYAGVTVERKLGTLRSPTGRLIHVLDLPGAYSLIAMSADEAVTRDIVTGRRPGEPLPDLLVCVVDATNLRLVLEAKKLGLPIVMDGDCRTRSAGDPGRPGPIGHGAGQAARGIRWRRTHGDRQPGLPPSGCYRGETGSRQGARIRTCGWTPT